MVHAAVLCDQLHARVAGGLSTHHGCDTTCRVKTERHLHLKTLPPSDDAVVRLGWLFSDFRPKWSVWPVTAAFHSNHGLTPSSPDRADRRYWYMPIPLIQRSILIVASQLMTFRAAERYLVLAGLLLIMLMAHALMQPYEAKRDNRTQTLLLAV